MSFTYVVKADISDITKHIPKKDDRFLVDTNVLFWWFYPSDLVGQVLKKKNLYADYLKKLRNTKATLYYTATSLLEIVHIVEKTLYEQYCLSFPLNGRPDLSAFKKEYRHTLDDKREELLETVDAMWKSIQNIARCLDTTMTLNTNHHLLTTLMSDYRMDSYDYLYLQAMHTHHITRIITDDGDFSTVAHIEVYTANTHVIREAREQDRLRTR